MMLHRIQLYMHSDSLEVTTSAQGALKLPQKGPLGTVFHSGIMSWGVLLFLLAKS